MHMSISDLHHMLKIVKRRISPIVCSALQLGVTYVQHFKFPN